MEPIAHVKEIWRYPVKSMGGESLDAGTLTSAGMLGDRLWAVLDEDGEIKSARQWSKLLQMTASYSGGTTIDSQLFSDEVPDVDIHLPDGGEIRSRAPAINTVVGEFLGQVCRIEPRRHSSDTKFYTPPKERNRDNMDIELDRLEGEADFDFSQTPEEIFKVLGQYMTPPGTYFDTFPLHMVSSQSMGKLANASEADADRRRFRPNLFLDFVDGAQLTPEESLVGKRIRIGDAVIHVRAKTFRCSIPSRPQPLLGLHQDPNMTRAMVNHFERHIGVYANIEVEGKVELGDPVFLIS